MAKRLTTDRAVRNVKTQGRHPVGETLYLMVWPSGRKSWVQRLAIKGGRKDRDLAPIRRCRSHRPANERKPIALW